MVEDDRDLREILQVILESNHWATEVAADGHQALDQAKKHRPAVVLLDLDLPDLTGEDVVAGLRARGQDDVPIVIVSADMWVAERAAQIGAADYLAKPFHVDEILAAVEHALAN